MGRAYCIERLSPAQVAEWDSNCCNCVIPHQPVYKRLGREGDAEICTQGGEHDDSAKSWMHTEKMRTLLKYLAWVSRGRRSIHNSDPVSRTTPYEHTLLRLCSVVRPFVVFAQVSRRTLVYSTSSARSHRDSDRENRPTYITTNCTDRDLSETRLHVASSLIDLKAGIVP